VAGRYPGVTRRGKGYQIAFQYEGVRYREMLANLPDTAKGNKEASDILASIRREITIGTFEYQKRFPRSKHSKSHGTNLSTVEVELDNWMRLNEKQLAKSTREDYRRRIDKHLIPVFGHHHIKDLTRTHIYEWLQNVTLSPKSIRNTLCPLMSTFTEAMRAGRLDSSPLSNIRLPKLETREPKPFNDIEIGKILDQLVGQVRNYFSFAFETGLRTSELIALKWEDIDLQQAKVFVRRAKVRNEIKPPKTSAGRRAVVLSRHAKNLLNEQMELSGHQEFVFLNPGANKPWKDDKALRVSHWYPALKRARVEIREPYQTRHTFASRKLSIEKVVPILLAREMGHSDCSQIYKNYARWIPQN
jgi:integrase